MKPTTTGATTAILASAIAGLLVASAQAQVHPEKPTYKYEKCYGVVKAGLNDCFTANSSCAGTSKQDAQKDAWVYVPDGTCKKLIGGSNEPKKS
jgi:uncharacterized membrane protein